jgi:hypothetical protein
MGEGHDGGILRRGAFDVAPESRVVEREERSGATTRVRTP